MKISLIGAVLCAICLQPAAAADGYAGDKLEVESTASVACPVNKSMRRPPVVTGGGRITILGVGNGK